MPDAIQQLQTYLRTVKAKLTEMRGDALTLASDLAAAADYVGGIDLESLIMSKADDLVESLVTLAKSQQAQIATLTAESTLSDQTVADVNAVLAAASPPPVTPPATEPTPAPPVPPATA